MDIACRKSHTFCYLCHPTSQWSPASFGSSSGLVGGFDYIQVFLLNSHRRPHCQRWPPSVRKRQSQTSHRKDTSFRPPSLQTFLNWPHLDLLTGRSSFLLCSESHPLPGLLRNLSLAEIFNVSLILLDLLFQHLKLFMFLPFEKALLLPSFPSQPNF